MKGMVNYRCPNCGKLKPWPPMLRSIKKLKLPLDVRTR